MKNYIRINGAGLSRLDLKRGALADFTMVGSGGAP